MEEMVKLNKKPKVSIIMLTYNREHLVERAIRSILNQTFGDFEFIIIDNGSTDRSGIIAKEFEKEDDRIKVLSIPKSNIGTGRNVGLEVANGDYITFIDDDDFAEEDFLEFLYNLALNNNADISICGSFDKCFDKKIVMNSIEAVVELMIRNIYNAAFPTKLFKAKLMSNLRFPEEGKFDDISMMYKLIANANAIVYHGLSKYTFYRHLGNNSIWTTNHKLLTKDILEEYLNVYKQRTEWLTSKFPEKKLDFLYFECSFILSMIDKIERYEIIECYEHLYDMKDELRKNYTQFISSKYIKEFEREWLSKYI